jgi:hypothetical protein
MATLLTKNADCTIADFRAFLIANGQDFTGIGLRGPDRTNEVDEEDLKFLRNDKLAAEITDEEPVSWEELKNRTLKIGKTKFKNEFTSQFSFGTQLSVGWRDEIRKMGKSKIYCAVSLTAVIFSVGE